MRMPLTVPILMRMKSLLRNTSKAGSFSVAVVDGKAYPIIEIAPKQGFYDYKNKYQAGSTVETCPAEISPELTEKMQHYAEAGAKALCIEGYARFDS